MRFIPLPPWSPPAAHDVPRDMLAAITVVFLGVPQGMAYAVIAGLPPAVGLFASTWPTVVGSLLRSSSHVVSGPTNALSLLVGAAVAKATGQDPLVYAVTLSLLVGCLQIAAGLLRLGTIVDFISSSVVLGYITGAAVLIAASQLHNLTGTERTGQKGTLLDTLTSWTVSLNDVEVVAVAFALGSLIAMLLWRRFIKKIPAAVVVTALAIALQMIFDLDGLKTVNDLAQIPSALPSFTVPDLSIAPTLLPTAVACTVLSLLESNAVARAMAQQTKQDLDANLEFIGQGASNLTAAFFGGYPASGSPSRSALNVNAGARTRLAGVYAGLLMLAILYFLGPVLNYMPVAALAGILFVVAKDLIDVRRIKAVWGAGWVDRLAFLSTAIGTWIFPLDLAIYVGVGVSLVLFLRKARLLTMREVVVGEDGDFVEFDLSPHTSVQASSSQARQSIRSCPRIRMVQVQGALFFGAANELSRFLDDFTDCDQLEVLVLRLRRASGMDATVALRLAEYARRLRAQKKRLVIIGLDDKEMRVLEGSGAAEVIGHDNLGPIGGDWLANLREQIERATEEKCGDCERCPLRMSIRA